MAFVSVTRLRLRSNRYLLPFLWHSLRSIMQARSAVGNLETVTLRDAGNVYWTVTLWEAESDMRKFMVSGAHKTAMPKLLNWCDEGHVAHWEQASTKVPEWRDAHRRLVTEGRPSKVHYPSARHANLAEIPAPRA